jgi:hypothetical protein
VWQPGGRQDKRDHAGAKTAADFQKVIAQYKIGPIFTPPVVSKIEGPLSTLTSGFATNWPGGSYDPETHTAYIYSQSGASPLATRSAQWVVT